MKELTKHNHCARVPNGSSDKSGRVNTNVDTPNGNLNEDYLPSPTSLKANLSIEYSNDMAELENCLNVIQDSLESKIETNQPKELCNKGVSEQAISKNGNDLATLHCVSLESLKGANTTCNSKSTGTDCTTIVNDHVSLQANVHGQNVCEASNKVETISIAKTKLVDNKSVNASANLEHTINGVELIGPELNQRKKSSNNASHLSGKSIKCNGKLPSHPQIHVEKQYGHGKSRNKYVANGKFTTKAGVVDCNSNGFLANGIHTNSTSVKANGYITINEDNYIEISYDSSKHQLTHSKSINGKLPNGDYHIMEDSPSKKYRGRGSVLPTHVFYFLIWQIIISPRFFNY